MERVSDQGCSEKNKQEESDTEKREEGKEPGATLQFSRRKRARSIHSILQHDAKIRDITTLARHTIQGKHVTGILSKFHVSSYPRLLKGNRSACFLALQNELVSHLRNCERNGKQSAREGKLTCFPSLHLQKRVTTAPSVQWGAT